MKACMVIDINGCKAGNFQPSFYRPCTARPKVTYAWRFLACLVNETRINGYYIMPAPMFSDQFFIKRKEIKCLPELLAIALFCIFAVPFKLKKVNTAFYTQKKRKSL
ncbi:hypothetical protein GALL_512820 [mine drainage metagenome]|uniref:Uncharacterized protein n=1 Tax=mine drainage metagenome TaxID=410659 RepID=A0A1J5P7E2_9ZZZZ